MQVPLETDDFFLFTGYRIWPSSIPHSQYPESPIYFDIVYVRLNAQQRGRREECLKNTQEQKNMLVRGAVHRLNHFKIHTF